MSTRPSRVYFRVNLTRTRVRKCQIHVSWIYLISVCIPTPDFLYIYVQDDCIIPKNFKSESPSECRRSNLHIVIDLVSEKSEGVTMSQLVDKAKNFVAEKVANMKKPEATVTNVDLKGVSRSSVEYNAQVSVINPYGHPIPICQISYSLKSAGRFDPLQLFSFILIDLRCFFVFLFISIFLENSYVVSSLKCVTHNYHEQITSKRLSIQVWVRLWL